MRILVALILLSFMAAANSAECVAIDRDFASYYGTTKDDPLLAIDANISGSKKDKLICVADSCGSAGCECALYVPVDDCMKRVLEFRGSHKILGEKKDGMSAIEIRRKGDPIAPPLKKVYVWDKDRRHYVEDGK